MERVGYLLGLIGLALAVFPDSRFFHWVGIPLLVVGTAVLAKAYISRNLIQLLFYRRALLANMLNSLPSTSSSHVTDLIVKLARVGEITLYGELGSSKTLVPIPPEYFRKYTIIYFMGHLHTHDPSKMPSEQDSDELYFNIYAPVSLLRVLERMGGGRSS